MTTTWGAVFGDGWDGALINPLSRAEAAARDHTGDPYAVVLLGDDRVQAEIRVAWAEEYLAVLHFDRRGRTRSVHEFRAADEGDLALWRLRTWEGPESSTDEEFARTAARESSTWQRSTGRRSTRTQPRGDLGDASAGWSEDPAPRLPRPAFGQWSELLGGSIELVDAPAPGLPTARSDAMPWWPVEPRRPGDLAGLFIDGTERPVGGAGPGPEQGRADEVGPARIETVPAGRLRVPSGRLAAVDPGRIGSREAPAPFRVTVPPGDYPVTVSRAHLPGTGGRTRVAAVRLEVGDRPVLSWQMALTAGQDRRDLGEGEFFGVTVGSGCVGLVDPELWDTLGDTGDAHDLTADLEEFTRHRDGGMVAFAAGRGDGTYPTWIGRDAAGEVVCFVTDLLL